MDEVNEVLGEIDVASWGDTLVEVVSTWGLRVVGAVAVLFLGMIIARLVRRSVTRLAERTQLDATLIPFLANLAYYAVATFVVIAVLGLFGIPTTSFVAVLGAAGLAVGLALQGSLSNFAAGVMLLVFRPFRLGDYVEVAGVEGAVEEIGIFASSLNTLDNTHVVLPNASIWGATIKNFTKNPKRRNDLVFGISYSDDIDQARRAILAACDADPRVLKDPKPQVWVTAMGDSSVDLLVAPWCEPADYWDLRFDLYQKVKEALEAGGCVIPFPQRDVHLIREPGADGA